MIMMTLVRGYHEVMHIHKVGSCFTPTYMFDVTSSGVNVNDNWEETFKFLREAVDFAKKHGWKEVE